nr:hypothetical protein [Tanacetum cinerariifolium]
MNRGFLDSGGRKNNHRKKTNTDTGTSLVSESNGILSDATPRVDVAEKVVSPSVVNETVATEKLSPVKWHPDVNLLKEYIGTVPIWVKLHGVPVTTFSEDGFSAIATKLGTPLMLDSYASDMCIQSLGRSSYASAMIELRADAELKDNIIVAMHKITREGYYTCNIRIKKLIIEGKVTLVDDEGKPLEKVASSYEYDSEDEVASVDNDMANFLAKKDGYDTQSLLEQWTESYENVDYGYDSYDDDMYEGQDIPDKLQAICDKLDITVRGRKPDRSSYSRAMIELRADVKLRDNIVVAMPKIIGKGFYTCAGETMNLKKPSQTLRGVSVGPEI